MTILGSVVLKETQDTFLFVTALNPPDSVRSVETCCRQDNATSLRDTPRVSVGVTAVTTGASDTGDWTWLIKADDIRYVGVTECDKEPLTLADNFKTI
jgi:hypothetical protein